MSIRSRITLGLLAFATLPVVGLGWYVSYEVSETQRASAVRMQVAEQQSIEEMRNLGRRAAKKAAEDAAAEIARLLRRRPGARLADVTRVDSVRRALTGQQVVGCRMKLELLVNDAPVEILASEPVVRPASMSELTPASKAEKYTFVATVPGTDLKVGARVYDLGIRRTVDRLVRSVERMGDRTEHETGLIMSRLRLMLVVAVTVLVIFLTVAGGQLAKTIIRPVVRLTEAAERMRQGDRDVDLTVRGAREIEVLSDTLHRAVIEMQSYAQSLEDKNLELDVARRLEVKANEELKQAQDEMVQMEKMSSLGRLVAGVAHEINTPTGTIYNITEEAGASLASLVGGLDGLRGLTKEELGVFVAGLDLAVANRLSPERVTRKERRETAARLEAAGIAEPREHAELLAKWHVAASDEADALCRLLADKGLMEAFAALVEIHAGMKVTRTSAQRISEIVKALKFYSHSNEKQEAVATDVNQTVRDALVIAHNRLKHRAEVTLDLEEGLPPVMLTSGITEVWVNLLVNACDAIEEKAEAGGPRMGEIRVRTFSTRTDVVIGIADNGKAIPPDVEGKLFDPFFTTKPPGKGTGLGLSVVMGTVKRSGGAVALKHDWDFKEFEITLPREAPKHV
jgi:C4-dicarboxylate-specific signal transduction histidine kinase